MNVLAVPFAVLSRVADMALMVFALLVLLIGGTLGVLRALPHHETKKLA